MPPPLWQEKITKAIVLGSNLIATVAVEHKNTIITVYGGNKDSEGQQEMHLELDEEKETEVRGGMKDKENVYEKCG